MFPFLSNPGALRQVDLFFFKEVFFDSCIGCVCSITIPTTKLTAKDASSCPPILDFSPLILRTSPNPPPHASIVMKFNIFRILKSKSYPYISHIKID